MTQIFGEKGDSKQSTTVDIPDFLQGGLNNAARISDQALSGLSALLRGGTFTGFDPLQTEGQEAALDVARGGGGFLPTAEQFFLDSAGGVGLDSFLPETAFDTLSGAAGSGSSIDFLPPEARAALESTARGDFLFGGGGFDEMVDAAVRSATPHIASAFGGTRGGANSIFAKDAVGQTAVDAALAHMQRERDRQINAAGTLAGFGSEGANRSLTASNILSDFAVGERDRRERSAARLPEIGLLRSDILRNLGGERRALEDERLRSPIEDQMMLLQAALGSLPIEALLGQTSIGDFSRFGLGLSGE